MLERTSQDATVRNLGTEEARPRKSIEFLHAAIYVWDDFGDNRVAEGFDADVGIDGAAPAAFKAGARISVQALRFPAE